MIKKLISLILSLVFLSLPVFGEEYKTLQSGEIFLNDTFEYQLDDTSPSGYTLVRRGNGCTLKREEENRAILCSYKDTQTEQSMYFDKNMGGVYTGKIVLECKIKTSSEFSEMSIFSAKSYENTWVAQMVNFTRDGKIKFRGSEVMDYSKNTQYHIILFVDMASNKISGKINTVNMPEKTFTISNIKALRFEINFYTDYSVRIDDIRIYGGNTALLQFPEPVYNKDYALAQGGEYAKIFERPTSGEVVLALSETRPRILVNKEHINKMKSLYKSDEVAKKNIDYMINSATANITSNPVGYADTDARTVAQRIKNRVGLIGIAYLYTGDDRYAERLWREAESFCAFPDWFPTDHLSHAEFLYSSAFIYDWLYDWFKKEGNEGKREILYNAIMEKGIDRCRQVYTSAAYGYKNTFATLEDNISAVCNGGVICVCLALLEKENNDKSVLDCMEFSIKAPEKFLTHFAPDGGWYEGFGYASYAIRYFVQALKSLENSCGGDFGLSNAPGFSDGTDFYIYMTAPGGIFNFHDNTWYYRRGSAEMYYFANEFEKPYLGYYANKFKEESNSSPSFIDLAFYEGGYKNENIPADRYFKGIETAAFTSDDYYLGVHAGKVGVSHGEFDAGSFIYDALGERWVEDLGPDSYSLTEYNTVRDDFPYYRRRAEGHNTLLINPSLLAGQNTNGDTKITYYHTNEKNAGAVMDLTSAYDTYSANSVIRTFELDKENQAITISDNISCTDKSEIYSFFHTSAEIEISEDGKRAFLHKNGKICEVNLNMPSNAVLSQMDAVPLASSPVREGQNKNEGIKKLFVNLKDVEQAEIKISFTPFVDNSLCHFSESGNSVKADVHCLSEKGGEKVLTILAGYNEKGQFSVVDVKSKIMEKGFNEIETDILKKDIKNYRLYVSYDNKANFKTFSGEVK